MTNSIVKAFEDGAKEIGESAEKGATAYAGHVEEAGGILAKSGERHETNDSDLGADMSKITAPKEDPSLPKSPSGSGSSGAASGAGADEEAAAKAAAEKAAADKAAEDAATQARIAELRTQGHGPQRHLDASDDQLVGRLGTPIMAGKKGAPPTPAKTPNGYIQTTKKMDPARPGALGMPDSDPLKYKDNYSIDKKTGKPANHKCGEFSTAFGDAESMVKADAAGRAKIPAGTTGHYSSQLDATDTMNAIGPDGIANLRGKYIDPKNPLTGTQVNYKDVNFTGTGIVGHYDQDASGEWKLTTMYPTPDPAVNQ
jgi:hypothetical protein